LGGIAAVAKALNDGDPARACIAAVFLGLPEIPEPTPQALLKCATALAEIGVLDAGLQLVADAILAKAAARFVKFNSNHDEAGRFAASNAARGTEESPVETVARTIATAGHAAGGVLDTIAGAGANVVDDLVGQFSPARTPVETKPRGGSLAAPRHATPADEDEPLFPQLPAAKKPAAEAAERKPVRAAPKPAAQTPPRSRDHDEAKAQNIDSWLPRGNGELGFKASEASSELARFPPDVRAAAARYQAVFGQVYGAGANVGQCAQLTHEFVPGLGSAQNWRPNTHVQGVDIAVGTPVATFNDFDGKGRLTYGPPGGRNGASGKSHTGIYLGQDSSGVYLLNQWHDRTKGPSGAIVSRIKWDRRDFESATRYYTISPY